MNVRSNCYYHPRTSSIVTGRNLLDGDTICGIQNLLPEDERYALKYVMVCLGNDVSGEVDRDSLVAALEVFGQIRDSGVSPNDILRELKEKADKVAPAVRARRLGAAAAAPKARVSTPTPRPRKKAGRRNLVPRKG